MISSVWFETVHSLLLPQPGPKTCENTDALKRRVFRPYIFTFRGMSLLSAEEPADAAAREIAIEEPNNLA
jgi:hypothetical protein